MMLIGYSDLQLIGEGGLGKVYRARKDSTGGLVAIKELRDVEEASPAWHRARRELEALLRLKGHAHVIGIEEVVQGPDGPCLVMEYAPNGSLMDRLNSSSLSGPELVMVGQQVCNALSAAHAMGIVHRDVKPHNMLIDSFGQVKVCDFGIAQLARDGEANTKTSAITMAYASPEELDDDGIVGPPADVYSFGATMLHLITGKRPTFKNRFDTGTIDLTAADPALAPVLGLLRQSMAHEPDDRPTIDDLGGAFDDAAQQLGRNRVRSLVGVGAPVVAAAPPDDATVVRSAAAEVITCVPGEVRAGGLDAATIHRGTPTAVSREPHLVRVQPTPGASAPRSSRRRMWSIAAAVALLGLGGAVFAMAGGDDSAAVVADPATSVAVTRVMSAESAATVSATSSGTTTTVDTVVGLTTSTAPVAYPATTARRTATTAATVAPTTVKATTTTVKATTTTVKATTTTVKPPQNIAISQGALNTVPLGTCYSAGQCKWVIIRTNGWSPGAALTITCHSDDTSVGPYVRTADSSGNYTTASLCMFGNGSRHVYVVISGVQSNTVSTWNW